MSQLSILAGKGGRAALARTARALQLLIPRPDLEPEFRTTARFILDHWDEIAHLAPAGAAGDLSTRGMLKEEGGDLAAMLIGVAQTALLPMLAGEKARRYLAALVVEIALSDPAQIEQDSLKNLARVVRLELKDLRKDDASRFPIPDPSSLLDLICWMDRQPQRSNRFPEYFWTSWRRHLRDAALRIVHAGADAGADAGRDVDAAEGLAFEPNDDESDGPETIRPRGLIPPEYEADRGRPRSPGLERVIANALLSSYTALESFSTNSTTVLADVEATAAAARLMAAADKAWDDHDLRSVENSLGRGLILATGTAPGQIPLLRWTQLGSTPPSPAGISLCARWLVRRELVPEHAAGELADASTIRAVWVPLPEALRQRLLRVTPSPCVGEFVLGSLQAAPPDDEGDGPASNTSLRRTFLSAVARKEPLGITGAQWATGDDLGVDDVPLYYDRFSADGLVDILEGATFPWFRERAGRARQQRPSHFLGSRVTVPATEIRRFFREIRDETREGDDLDSLAARLSARTRNLAHGLVACTGHRPVDALGELTLAHFDVVERIAVLQDKRVAPDWPHRPVALAGSICDELRALVSELRVFADRAPTSALGEAAALALSGDGPVLLCIASAREVRAFGRQAYIGALPETLRAYCNFARHLLNHALIGRVPEALRVGQMGWHGSREGAWAEASPWSVVAASAQLQKVLEQHLADIGWRPIGKAAAEKDLPVVRLQWRDQEQEHRRDFRDHVASLRRKLAVREHERASELLPALQSAISSRWPSLSIDERFALRRIADAPIDQEPIEVTKRDIKRIEAAAAPGNARSRSRLAIRNALSIALRRGQAEKVVRGALPRRTHWSFGKEPSPFLRAAPGALRVCRSIHDWLIAADTSLSLEARTVVGLLLWGGYSDLRAIRATMIASTTLSRVHAYSDVVLADVGVAASPESDEPAYGTLAFHGLAALALLRWHRERTVEDIDLHRVGVELSAAIPPGLLAARCTEVLDEIAAVAKARNALTMDGIARLVGVGRVQVCAMPVTQIAASYDDHPVTRTAAPTRQGDAPKRARGITGNAGDPTTTRIATVRTLMAEVSKALIHRRPRQVQDRAARQALNEMLSATLRRVEGPPTTVDLLARFVVVLLDEGGVRKEELVLSTIHGYLSEIAYGLDARLGDDPLARSDGEWHESFLRIVAGSTPRMRWRRGRALHRFHTAVSRHIQLPDVDLASLSLLAGCRMQSYAPDLLSQAQRESIADRLGADFRQLEDQSATAEELHAARGRQVYFATLDATSFRPGEAFNLIVGDVHSGCGETRLAVTQHRYQRLKTPRACRRVKIEGANASRTAALLDDWRADLRQRAGGRLRPMLPVFGQRDEFEEPLDRALLTERLGELIRWVTDRPTAVLYALRKTGVWEPLAAYQQSDPPSLWPLRDLLARCAHRSIVTTLTHYTHDPLVVFIRWFREESRYVDAMSIASATGRSLSRVRRAGDGASIRGRRDGAFRDRMLSMLERVPFAEVPQGVIHPPPEIRSEKAFLPDTPELDRTLRAWVSDGDLRMVTKARSWPAGVHERFMHAIARMRSDFGVGFPPNAAAGDIVVLPPRRLVRANRESSLENGEALAWTRIDPEVMVGMGASWLRIASMPGVPDGIPGLSSDWSRWHEVMGSEFSSDWLRRSFGAAQCREPPPPPGSQVRAWPLLRWQCLLYWLRAQLRMSMVG